LILKWLNLLTLVLMREIYILREERLLVGNIIGFLDAIVFAVPERTDMEIIRRAIKERNLRKSNAYMCKWVLTINSSFQLLAMGNRGDFNKNNYNIFSLIYLRVDEEELKKFKD
jgi:hypothetical protein